MDGDRIFSLLLASHFLLETCSLYMLIDCRRAQWRRVLSRWREREDKHKRKRIGFLCVAQLLWILRMWATTYHGSLVIRFHFQFR